MKYIKIIFIILFLSLFYASGVFRPFNLNAEFLLIFSGLCAFLLKNYRVSVAVALVCGVLMSGLGGRGFPFCVLSCVYFMLVCLRIKSGRRPYIKFIFTSCVFAFLFEAAFYLFYCFDDINIYGAFSAVILPSCVYNTIIAAVMYLLVKKIMSEKERYIF